jgi:hypothetical protein
MMFQHVHAFIFIIAIEALVFSIILRSKRVVILQMILFLASFVVDGILPNFIYSIFIIAQILFGLFILFKVKKAIDRDYLLVLEKTHRIPANLTKGNYWGL